MEERKLIEQEMITNIVKFAKDFARSRMPQYDTEWLLVAVYPVSKTLIDKVSELSWGRHASKDIPKNSFCRQYLLSNGEYKKMTVKDIGAGFPDVEVTKVIYLHELNNNYFRMDYNGIQGVDDGYGRKIAVGQGWQIDIEWDGTKFNPNPKSNHKTFIT